MRKLRFYLDRFGHLVITEQNPCGCHPFDLIIEYPNRETGGKGKEVSISFKNQQAINANTRRHGWERL